MRIVTADNSATRFSERYQQTYHSQHGALAESRYVFLEASGVAARLENQTPTSVLEIGFGLGLNFLITADAAESRGTPLNYFAFEHDLINRA
ncbi:MAG: hypothetical protein KTR35_23220, partial [Gammaproteobacteria bacterium]|nr:hypothetical protein [Gammaproteobacteria bacterium]